MTMLRFTHGGWDVVTGIWTAASKREGVVELCYQWGADGVSLFAGATSVRRVTLPISMREFVREARSAAFVDFRHLGDLS